MPIKFEFSGIELTGDVRSAPSEVERRESTPVRIGLIGDFRGRGKRGPVESGRDLAGRRLYRVDRDNLDSVLARLDVSLSLTLPADDQTPIVLTFRELDDFHPDRLLARA